jgi:DNA polymerase-3 subunit gamma/tau
MSHIAFYRKYRPSVFKDVIGQEYIVKTLENSIKNNKVAHAYIFAGPRGIGKTTFAKIFAKALNCLHTINGDACETCVNCTTINQKQTVDILELDAASNNGIEEVRSLIENVRYLPSQLNKKVYIIDEAHMLTTQAWNALLKTIEEAPEHVVFVFATTEMYKIPATIVSRCQYFQFNKFSPRQIKETINRAAGGENISISETALEEIVQLADGAARDALSMFEQLASLTNNNITEQDVNEVFGLVNNDKKIQLINYIISLDTKNSLNLLDTLVERGINILILTDDIINILIDKLVYIQTSDASLLKKLTTNDLDKINLTQDKLLELINIWQEQYMKIKTSNDTRFYFELAIFSSMKIFASSTQFISAVVKEVEKVVDEEPSLPTLDKIFILKPVEPSVAEPKEGKKISEVKTIVPETKAASPMSVTFDIEQIFMALACNASKAKTLESHEVLNTLIKSNDNTFSCLKKANILLSSNNGIVFYFDDKLDANILNKNAVKQEFIKSLVKHTNKPLYIIGLDKNKVSQLKKQFDPNKKLPEPSISIFDIYLTKKENEVSDLASSLLGI